MNGLDQVSSPAYIVPAYGRTYDTKEAVIADWNAGKDFKLINGPYCSIRDIKHLACSSLWIDIGTSVIRVK